MAESRLDRHKETYREEAYELLNELETSLLELEAEPEDIDIISRVFRALHTLKGSGAMFGFDEIAAFAHDVENMFDLIRNGKLTATKNIIDLTLAARDHIKLMLASQSGDEGVDAEEGERILQAIRAIAPDQRSAPQLKDAKVIEAAPAAKTDSQSAPPYAAHPASAPVGHVTYRVIFRPPADLFTRGVNPLYLIEDLQALGRCHAVAHLSGVPPLSALDPERCYTHWDLIVTTDKGIEAIRDVFIFIADDSDIRISVIDDGGIIGEGADYQRLGEILIDRSTISREELERIAGTRKLIGEALVESGMVRERDIDSALTEQSEVKSIRSRRQTHDMASTIRVSSEKLDRLVDLVGELVTVQARLSQTAANRKGDAEILGISEEVERLTADLHDTAMSVRMVPIGTTFSKFRRLVRDLADGLGREINLTTSGAETELDKTVIERLGDPLVHLIRNCVDHGIEPPGVREAAGKFRAGTVHLSAEHAGAEVHIKISDDGSGINTEAVRAKAIERGLLHPDAAPTEHELLNMIFAPGFSTASRVSDVSGRGVGMDVVKRSIESLRGTVDVMSKRGAGTTILLRIPLTLAIIDGLLVRIADAHFVLPLSAVEECVELTARDIRAAHGRNLINVRGEMVPYIPLRERFDINEAPPERQQVTIVNSEGIRIGFVVDQVLGEHQTVIKSLSRVYRQVRGISGATILGDGTVALILDIVRLIEEAERAETAGLEA